MASVATSSSSKYLLMSEMQEFIGRHAACKINCGNKLDLSRKLVVGQPRNLNDLNYVSKRLMVSRKWKVFNVMQFTVNLFVAFSNLLEIVLKNTKV